MAADNPNNQEAGRTMFLADTNLTMMNSANTPYPTRSMVLAMAVAMVLRSIISTAQAQNLVPNHSFEVRDSCLEVNTAYTLGTGPLGWFSAGGTGDYFMSCIPDGGFNDVPLSYWAFQYAQEGECYVGVATYAQATGFREYFMIELAQPLVVGQMYFASFYASPTWGGPQPQVFLASSHIGMLFTTQPLHWTNGDPWPTGGNFAHVYHPWLVTDTVGWTLVSGSFVADSAYQYLMIGNHFDNSMTDTLHFADLPWDPRAHALIDNVCVTADPKGCPLALGLAGHMLDEVALFPNPASGEVGLSGVPLGTTITIHDGLGRLVLREEAVVVTWRTDASSWARGAYVLRLEQEERSRSFKFVLIE